MTLDLLWTDICFLAIVLVACVWLLTVYKKEPVKKVFQTIFSKPTALCSGIILMFFLTIAVLDSIHYRLEGQVKTYSVLDNLLSPLNDFYEKSYSAPFAKNLYVSETVMKGSQAVQVYAALEYPPKNLFLASGLTKLITKVVLNSVFISVVSVLCLWILVLIYRQFIKKSNRLTWLPSRTGWVGLSTLCVCIVIVISTYWLSRYVHILGTGKIGQDIFYYTVKSIRTGLIIGTLTTLFMMPLALLLGISAGYFGKRIDDVIQFIYTTLSSIPGVLLITASVLSMQTYIANHPEQFPTLAQTADARLLALCVILGITSWTSLCRLLRAETLKLREIDFVLAAKALGTSSYKILWKHLLPNVMHIVLITLVLDFSFLVLAEAVLSYVGVGVSPLTISWGNMINAARLELAREPIVWWPMFAAFLFMFLLVLSSNLFADAVRDALDPRQSG